MAKVSLILEGGGMRGLYTAGVLDYFIDKGLVFKDIIGVSAGACNSVSYISGQRGRNLAINTCYCRDKRYLDLFGLITRGSIFNMDFLFDDIPNKLIPFDYNNFKASGCRLTAVSTDCVTGRPVYTPIQDMSEDSIYVRASSSIPLVSPVVKVDGMQLVDGGPSDSIPISYSVENGFDIHIVVLTQHNGYRKKKNKFIPLYRFAFKKYPSLAATIENRHMVYNQSINTAEQLEKENKAIIIRPDKPVEVSRFERNPENLRKLYKTGYEDASAKFDRILELCQAAENFSYQPSI